jgi:hypothetical protein
MPWSRWPGKILRESKGAVVDRMVGTGSFSRSGLDAQSRIRSHPLRNDEGRAADLGANADGVRAWMTVSVLVTGVPEGA